MKSYLLVLSLLLPFYSNAAPRNTPQPIVKHTITRNLPSKAPSFDTERGSLFFLDIVALIINVIKIAVNLGHINVPETKQSAANIFYALAEMITRKKLATLQPNMHENTIHFSCEL